MTYDDYERELCRVLWLWADQHHRGKLDGGKRQGRLPVLAKGFADENVLLPPNGAKEAGILAAIHRRHRWFSSLKSSQALAQSVFGAIRVFGRLDLLEHVQAECGQQAFYRDSRGWTLDIEHEVDFLNEPRRTNVDALLKGPGSRVAVECKLTEREFGPCSSPREPVSSKEHCDGSYRVQHGRKSRCALTEIGVRYWDHLPRLFNWPASRDHTPCPFRGTYQIGRNALAAAAAPGIRQGHMLLLYDARNPEFHGSVKAGKQWRQATGDCRVPGLLRRVTWQRLLSALTTAPELDYLVAGMEKKYGLAPA